MKNSKFFLFVSTLLFAVAIFSGCQSSGQKVENARDNVTDAQQDLAEANKEYRAELENYRRDQLVIISNNDQKISDLRRDIANRKNDLRADYEKNLFELEKKNKDLKTKMSDYRDNGKDNWESFKREFSHDMDELGKSLNNFTDNNRK